MATLKNLWRDLRQYPSATAGLAVIAFLIGISIYAMVSIPYSEALRLWRGGDVVWRDSPRNARPEWVNLFTSGTLPKTIVLNSRDGQAEKTIEDLGGTNVVTITFTFDFPYDGFPQEVNAYFTADYLRRQPHVSMSWHTPDGRDIRIGDLSLRRSESFRFAQESRLVRRLRGELPQIGLFADPDQETPTPLKGEYQFRIEGLLFEDEGDIDATLVLYGQVHGLGGTDHRRRDLMVALLWGTPIALAFGLLAALGTSVTTMIIAAIGVWFGGVVDSTIRRITEVNLILPFLPILIMVGIFWSRSIWVILTVVILLSIFSGQILSFRAIFLQVKEAPYIEAAKAYGAGNMRIIFNYMLPRLVPILVPALVLSIPTFVFLEATLALLGLGDPVLPTWGKLIDDANRQGALHNQYYYWILQPVVLLMMTGVGFSLIGFALDRIFNPRLRGV
jgi:peptide/nickel transport system permease protein